MVILQNALFDSRRASNDICSSAPGILSAEVTRISIGEEISFSYVASTLSVGIELWNHAIDTLKTHMDTPEAVLEILDAGEEVDEASMNKAVDSLRARIDGLKKIQLKEGEHSLW